MSEYAALVAIDWADKQHAICLYDQTTGQREHTTVKHTPSSFAGVGPQSAAALLR